MHGLCPPTQPNQPNHHASPETCHLPQVFLLFVGKCPPIKKCDTNHAIGKLGAVPSISCKVTFKEGEERIIIKESIIPRFQIGPLRIGEITNRPFCMYRHVGRPPARRIEDDDLVGWRFVNYTVLSVLSSCGRKSSRHDVALSVYNRYSPYAYGFT